MNLTVAVEDALIEQLAERVLDRAEEKRTERGVAGGGDDDGWLRGCQRIASYIDAKPSRVYAHKQIGLPVEHDGSTLIARKADLDAWVRAGGGKRT